MNPDGSEQTRLTDAPEFDTFPSWSPDGRYIVFNSEREGAPGEIFVMDADGGNITRITDNDISEYWVQWQPVAP